MHEREVKIFSNAAEVARAAAELVLAAADAAIGARGKFSLCLSGGSTPKALYQELARDSARGDWPHWEFHFGDERCVPPEHPDSNYRMAREALFAPLRIPATQIFRMQAERGDLAQAAKDYENILLHNLGCENDPAAPVFDLVLLGMGDDGHTASLFPGAESLNNAADWVIAAHAPSLGVRRMTITFRTIDRARTRMMLVCGTSKAARLKEVFAQIDSNQPREQRLPIARISPARGTTVWLLDNAAAAQLDR